MFIALLVASVVSQSPPPTQRIERLVALARLDAAVRYFDPSVATRASTWDSLVAANVVRIADAPSSAEYGRLVSALMTSLHDAPPVKTGPQHALSYNGFPNPTSEGSGGYGLEWRNAGTGQTYRVDMGEKVSVDVRLSEPYGDAAPSPKVPPIPTTSGWRDPYPPAGYRILGAARLWSTIHYFYPYKSLIGENWDDQLRAALPAVEQAGNAIEYGKAIAAFAAHIHDAHVNVSSPALGTFLGKVSTGVATRLIENQLVVTRIADSSAARAGLHVGDVVVSIDGEPTQQRIARITPYFSASTPQSLRYRLETSLLAGPDTSAARLVVRGATGEDRTVLVPRGYTLAQLTQKQRVGSIIRVLPGNIGYIDLDRLPQDMVDSAFRVLATTKASVLDDRGYPLGTAWPIAPRLNTHGDGTTAAKFKRLIVPSPDTTLTTAYQFDQPIPPAQNVTKYMGKTVMLVDERTLS